MISAGRCLLLALVVGLSACGKSETVPPPQAPLVATLGDSITAGAPKWSPDALARATIVRGRPTPKSQYQYWAERATNGAFRFRNCGVEGDRTDEIAARLEGCIDHAQVVVLQGGTNDISQGRTPASAAANIRRMVERAKDAGLEVLVTTVPPTNVRYPQWADEIRRLNELIERIAQEEDVPVIDFFGLLEDPRRPDRMPAKWTADGVHPTIAGYQRVGKATARQLE